MRGFSVRLWLEECSLLRPSSLFHRLAYQFMFYGDLLTEHPNYGRDRALHLAESRTG